ncbi:hypothetical protein MIR68_003207 [Amoeboaphelidium protococcarum]|nr:hypothetical protein MIR68_003207 [Amoeboaphelidium protococcarum]
MDLEQRFVKSSMSQSETIGQDNIMKNCKDATDKAHSDPFDVAVTRKTSVWNPSPLLCELFNVKVPSTDDYKNAQK